jgi:hypothetical protein
MKKIILTSLIVSLFAVLPIISSAQISAPIIWKIVGNVLQPINNSFGVKIPSLPSGCLSTDSAGKLMVIPCIATSTTQTLNNLNLNGNLNVSGSSILASTTVNGVFRVIGTAEIAGKYGSGTLIAGDVTNGFSARFQGQHQNGVGNWEYDLDNVWKADKPVKVPSLIATSSLIDNLTISNLNGLLTAVNGTVATTATSSLGLENRLTFSAPLSRNVNTVSLGLADGTHDGALASTTWTTFNNKVSSQWVDGGSGKLYYSGGNVGIGTTSPQAKLSVYGNMELGDPAQVNGIYQYNSSRTAYGKIVPYDITTGNMTLQTTYANGNIFILPGSAGNVGIGTTTPNTKLNIYGGGLGLNPGATAQPTCATSTRGTFWNTFGAAGVADKTEVCAKDASDVYSWKTLY